MEGAVCVEFEDQDGGLGGLACVDEFEGSGDAVVVDVGACGEEVGALGEAGALFSAAGDVVDFGADGDAVVAACCDCGEGGDNDGVVGFCRVGEVGEVRVHAQEAVTEIGEFSADVNAGQGAFHAGDDGGVVERGGEGVTHVAVGAVHHFGVGSHAGFDEAGEDLGGFVETDDHDRVGISVDGGGDFGVEVLGLRVVHHFVDDFAACGLIRLFGVLQQSGAVRVVEHQERGGGRTVVDHDVSERGTLNNVGRCGTEVQTVVVVVSERR